MENKRGQGLSTNAIVLIILAVVVLVVLILGFTLGWSQFAPWLSSDNIQQVADQCGVACSTGAQYAFCTQNRTLTVEGQDVVEDMSCYEISEMAEYDIYGIEKCPSLASECDSGEGGEDSSNQDQPEGEAGE